MEKSTEERFVGAAEHKDRWPVVLEKQLASGIHESIYQFQFPVYTKTNPSKVEQIAKIVCESVEALTEINKESPATAVEETLDIIHACETLLRMYDAEDPEIVDEQYAYVIEKNRKRGYYE